jgi:hypothetical protein
MRDVIYLLFHLLTTLAKLSRPGGGRTVIAENLLLKQQAFVHRNQNHHTRRTRHQPDSHKPLHHITGVDRVNYVECNLSFYPPG